MEEEIQMDSKTIKLVAIVMIGLLIFVGGIAIGSYNKRIGNLPKEQIADNMEYIFLNDKIPYQGYINKLNYEQFKAVYLSYRSPEFIAVKGMDLSRTLLETMAQQICYTDLTKDENAYKQTNLGTMNVSHETLIKCYLEAENGKISEE